MAWLPNHAERELYLRNLQTLQRMDERTDEDWLMAEMMTSDEEASSPVVNSGWSQVRRGSYSSVAPTLTPS